MRRENSQLRERAAQADAELQRITSDNYELNEEIHRYQTNVYDVPSDNVDYDAIIAKYKSLIAQKDEELRALKTQLERHKDEVHRVNMRCQELTVKS